MEFLKLITTKQGVDVMFLVFFERSGIQGSSTTCTWLMGIESEGKSEWLARNQSDICSLTAAVT